MMGIMPPECGKILELLGHVGIWMGQTGFSMWVCHGVSNNGGWPPQTAILNLETDDKPVDLGVTYLCRSCHP